MRVSRRKRPKPPSEYDRETTIYIIFILALVGAVMWAVVAPR
jgi:hypothetical protein